MRNLGAFFDVTMSMNDHVNRLVWSSYYQLRRIKSIRHALSHRSRFNSWIHLSFHELTMATAFWLATEVLTRPASFYSERGGETDFRLQPIWPLLRDWLCCLRFTQRIDFKRCLMVFKALHSLVLGYISDYGVRVSTNQQRSSLRSVSHNCLVVPPSSKTIKFAERWFGICSLTTWNSLPKSVKDADSTPSTCSSRD